MIKKIAMMSMLVSTLLYADIDQKGFFVGVDFSQSDYELEYNHSVDPTGFDYLISDYASSDEDNLYSVKAGYQYYFTRVYARYSKFDYKDTNLNKYRIEGAVIELNADYLPVFYTSESKIWNIRGIFGIGVGYNESELKDYDPYLFSVGDVGAGEQLSDGKQHYMEYGYQIGVMSETSIGLSVEFAYRVRYGDLLEFTDSQTDSKTATFDLRTKEIYIGVNYLF
jgi:hypothetical protein